MVQALCGATGKQVGLIELCTSAFDKTNLFVWIIARRSVFVSGDLQGKYACFAPALAAAIQRCFVPFPGKPAYTAGIPVSWD
ncbi:MAG: hypothetical protein IT292_11080 [Deltaproteobacteria bacterium]|nr:hypothetical protein [Deltaproteobacteria bacterium]